MNDDLIRNSLIAMTAAIPYAGGPISFLLDKYVPSITAKRQEEYIQKLCDELERIKERIDIKNLDTPEFKQIFTQLLQAAIQEYREEKLAAFRNLTINIAIQPDEFSKVDYYSKLIIHMIPDEIRIIQVLYRLDVLGELKTFDKDPKKRRILSILKCVYGWEDREYIMALLNEARRYMLIDEGNNAYSKIKRDGQFLSDLGIDFCKYIFDIKCW